MKYYKLVRLLHLRNTPVPKTENVGLPTMSLLHPNHLQLQCFLPRLSSRPARHFLHIFSPACSPPDKHSARTPNRPLDIDPALQALLNDADISISRANAKSRALRKIREPSGSDNIFTPTPRRELEVLEAIPDVEGAKEDIKTQGLHDFYEPFPRSERKSPAASFGSRGIGAIVLPFELQRTILRLISGV